jgi:hypothetical protein
MRSMACREYLRAASFVRRRAASEDNPNAKEILHDIQRSYNRLVEIESWLAQQQKYSPLRISGPSKENSASSSVHKSHLPGRV